jgi:hypothetical protein
MVSFVEPLVMIPATYTQLSANGHILGMHIWKCGRNLIHVIWRHVYGAMFFWEEIGLGDLVEGNRRKIGEL